MIVPPPGATARGGPVRPSAAITGTARGVALIDLIVTCAVVVVLSAVTLPSVHALREHDAGRMAAKHLAQRLQALRVEAIRRNRRVAMRFDPVNAGQVGAYFDGDGDGVSEADIARGVDGALDPERPLNDGGGAVSLRVLDTVPSPDMAGQIAAGSDAVRLGASNLLSFSPTGTATAGSIYLAAAGGPQMCVRVFGGTGRIRVLWFDRSAQTWRED